MSFLDDILARKAKEVEKAGKARSLEDLEKACASLPPVSSLKEALLDGAPPRIIAEIKRASPSRGAISPDLDAAKTAMLYCDHGAAAISILTDGPGFMGSLDDVREAARALKEKNDRAPILRKDFLIDPYQVWEARDAGADAVLLIVAALGKDKLVEMTAEVKRAGLEALVEAHDEEEMRIAAEVGAGIVGINNRNLRTFDVDPDTTLRLAPMAPEGSVLVVESGIRSPEDIRRYIDKGFRAFLIGEALVAAPDPGARLEEFLSCCL